MNPGMTLVDGMPEWSCLIPQSARQLIVGEVGVVILKFPGLPTEKLVEVALVKAGAAFTTVSCRALEA